MNKLKLWAVMGIMAVCLSACGMSEGQMVSMYVSQMTVYERRVEADAYDFSKLWQSLDGSLSEERRNEIVKLLTVQKGTFEETLTAVKEYPRCPKACVSLQSSYEEAFGLRIRHCDLLINFLKNEYKDNAAPSAEALAKLKEQNAEIVSKSASVEENIMKAKKDLVHQYREVQIPEVSSAS